MQTTANTEFNTIGQAVALVRRNGTVDQAGVNVSVVTARGTVTESYAHGRKSW